jgi:hypothetical protein
MFDNNASSDNGMTNDQGLITPTVSTVDPLASPVSSLPLSAVMEEKVLADAQMTNNAVEPDLPALDPSNYDNSNSFAPAPVISEPVAQTTTQADSYATDAPTQDYSSNITPEEQTIAQPVATTNNDLLSIKQEVLSTLSPLVDHLDQTSEEKFRTIMMMIQATDDQSLIKSAYASARSIEDEKVRAQALLDIVNEINYFTTHHAA